MTTAPAEVKGRCLCGACSFTATPVEMVTSVCHCETCRRWAGVQFSVDCGTALTLAANSPVSTYASSAHMDRISCRVCASPLYRLSKTDKTHYVVMQALDAPDDYQFTVQIFTDEKPRNYSFANRTSDMTGAEFTAMLEQQEGA